MAILARFAGKETRESPRPTAVPARSGGISRQAGRAATQAGFAILEKKSKIASERDEEARGLWRWLASHFDARRIVFVDESGFNTSMTRLRARAPKGKRAYGKVPRNLKARTLPSSPRSLWKEPWESR